MTQNIIVNKLKNIMREFFRKITALLVICAFSIVQISPIGFSQANAQVIPSGVLGGVLNLPVPGTMLSLSSSFAPPIIRGLTVYPDNPLRFGFIIDSGDGNLQGEVFEAESEKLIKYFLAALTTPEDEFWVNLSPYEKDRIIPDGLGTTALGRDMLAQDYLLKQLTASLMYPEEELGKKFWDRVYVKIQNLYGTTEILPTSSESGLRPSAKRIGSVGVVNTFNKVWIVPDKAVVYEYEGKVFVGERHLKVMLEEDYVAMKKNRRGLIHQTHQTQDKNMAQSEIIREIIIPEIEKEVNEGKLFANLRQIYNSMILATWYKQRLRESLLGKVYVDQNKVKGIDLEDKQVKQKIYDQYLKAFNLGVYNYIKEDYDPATKEIIPRKYFSGGLGAGVVRVRDLETRQLADSPIEQYSNIIGPESKYGNLNEAVVDLYDVGFRGNIGIGQKSEEAVASPITDQNSKEISRFTKLIIVVAVTMGLLSLTDLPEKIAENVLPQIEKLTNAAYEVIDQKGYWMNLVNQDKYAVVFERSGEFLQEPFAFEVLQAAALTYPTGPYQTSSADALKYFPVYADHPRSLEIAFMALENDGAWRMYDYFQDILSAPKGEKIVQKAIRLNPATALRALDLEDPGIRHPEGFKEYLRQSKDPVLQTVFLIHQTLYSKDLKLKIAALTDSIVNKTISIGKAVSIVTDSDQHFKELSKINLKPNAIGGEAVRNGLDWMAQDIVQSIQASLSNWGTYQKKDFIEGLTNQEIYILLVHGVNFLKKNIELQTVDYLYVRLKESAQEIDVLNSSFLASNFGKDFRMFMRMLASYDKLTDFLSLLGISDTKLYLEGFLKGKKLDHSYYNGGIEISNPAVQLIMAKFLLENQKELSLNEMQYYFDLVDQAKKEIDSIQQGNLFFRQVGHFQSQPFIQSKIRSILEKIAEEKPDDYFFQDSHYFINLDYGRQAFIRAAYQNPHGAFRPIDSHVVKVEKVLQTSEDPLIRKLFEITALDISQDKKYEVTLLMEDLLKHELSFSEAIEIVKDPFRLRKRLSEIKAQEGSIGVFAIEKYLSEFYLKMVKRVNDLHNESDDIRFALVNDAMPVDIYYLMVYGEQEIYTSTFNGIFDRLLRKMNRDSLTGTKLLENVEYLQFRSFVRLLTEFGRLNEFLSTMDESSKSQLLERFVKGIEKEKKYLQQAMVVADAFSMVEDKKLLTQLQKFIKEEFDRVTIENNQEGIVLYGILSSLFGEKAVINETWFKEMSDKFGLPSINKISTDKLFNQHGENIQRYFFYDDADGKQSFKHFLSFYENNSKWKVTFEENHIQIRSRGKGRKIVMFANKPDRVQKGAEDILAIFKERKISPHVVVHRGHSYHAPKTIKQIPSTTLIVSLGSCGGFHLVADVISHASNAHILSTKGAGSMYVNDPLLKMLNEQILSGEDTISWKKFWGAAEEHITSNYFSQYIAPQRNIGALFLKAYHKEIAKINSSSSPMTLKGTVMSLAFLISLGMTTESGAAGLSLDQFDRAHMVDQISLGIISAGDERTGIAVSHLGFPGFETVKFTYDAAVDSLVLKASGKQQEAERRLDRYAKALRFAKGKTSRIGILGIVKTFEGRHGPGNVRGLINALNVTSTQPQGQGQLEYIVTPGPNAFMAAAFLGVNTQKYLDVALMLGDALLSMQRSDGGVSDGDRGFENVNIEPHMDTLAVFLQLYEVTGDSKWKRAADNAWKYFVNSGAYRPEENTIWQGVHRGRVNRVFATDTYSWTMAGPGGDRMSLKELKGFTGTMLSKSLTKVTLELPDGKIKTVVLVDFADPENSRVKAERNGFHPMGSVEWTGGVILALQKNAVRFWKSNNSENKKTAQLYKALAEYLIVHSLNTFYELPGLDGLLSFYATGQNVATGHGWNTPTFYFKKRGSVIRGGSFISAWPVLPIRGVNPLILKDTYKKSYDQIPLNPTIEKKAVGFINQAVEGRFFQEKFVTVGQKEQIKGESFPQRPQTKQQKQKSKGDLWLQGEIGQDASHQWNSQALWISFSPEISLQKGQKVKITYSLQGGNVLGVQLIPKGISESTRGDMIVKRNVNGNNKTIEITVPSNRNVWRIAFQYGENAWGYLGGSMEAELTIHSIEVSSGSGSSPIRGSAASLGEQKGTEDSNGLQQAGSPVKSLVEGQEVGGIDFNSELLDLQIKRDGNGIPLPVSQQPIEQMNIQGFFPVIINISPITVPTILGWDMDETNSPLNQATRDPVDKKRFEEWQLSHVT